MTGLLRRVVAGLGGASLLGAVGCAGFWVNPGSSSSGSTAASTDNVYVVNATAKTVSGFAVGTATLTAVTNSPYLLGFYPTALAVNPTNTILFVAGTGGIYDYAVNSDGSLSALNGGNEVGAADVVSMDVTPDGQWLLALDANGVTVDEFQIDTGTGTLTPGTPASYSTGGSSYVPMAIKVVSTPSGEYAIAALGTAGDLVYPFDTSNGVLSAPVQLSLGVSSPNSDNALAVNPAGTYLFIARSGPGGGLAVYNIGAGGALSEVSGSPFAAGTQPYSVAVNGAGTDAYVANREDNTISGFSISGSGALTALSGSPYPSGTAVTALAVDNSGNYLLAAANGGSPDLTLYSYDSTTTGKLDFATSIATGTDPTGPVAIAATH